MKNNYVTYIYMNIYDIQNGHIANESNLCNVNNICTKDWVTSTLYDKGVRYVYYSQEYTPRQTP